MDKLDSAHLIPAFIFGGLLGAMLLAIGVSALDTLLVVCAAYAFVSIVEILLEPSKTTSPGPKQ